MIGTVVFALLLALHALQAWRTVHDDHLQQMRTAATLIERGVGQYLHDLGVSMALASTPVSKGEVIDLPTALGESLSNWKRLQPEIRDVWVVDAQGHRLAGSDALPPAVTDTHGDHPPSGRVGDPDPVRVGRAVPDTRRGDWALPIWLAVPSLSTSPGAPAWTVATIPVDHISRFWAAAPVTAQATLMLLRDDGYLLARFPKPPGADDQVLYGQPRSGPVMQHLRAAGFPREGEVDAVLTTVGSRFVTVFVRLDRQPITLLVSLRHGEIVAAWWQRTLPTLLAAALLAAVSIAAYGMILRRRARWHAELQSTARELGESNRFLEKAGELALIGGWRLDLRTRELAWTTQTRRIHEVPPHYRPTLETAVAFYPEDARPVIEAAVARGMATGEPWDLELPLRTFTGRTIQVRAQGQAEFEAGKAVRLFGAFQDVTEYRSRMQALEREQARRAQAEEHAIALDRLVQERGEMLGVLAHEVRQPLNSASAALQAARAQLRLDGPTAPLSSVTRAQEVMGAVLASIDNTLAVSALLAGTAPPHHEDIAIDLVIGLAVADLSPDQAARVRVRSETSTRTASMDASLVRLALRNLLINALRFTPDDGKVVLRVEDRDEPPSIAFEVIDDGPGFPPALQSRLFSRGAKAAHAGKAAGLGLGLYIVRRVAELHGGTVGGRNGPMGGAIVRLELPQGIAEIRGDTVDDTPRPKRS